jgi:5-methylcytosine-specific restriction endonuclease McrA
VGRKWGPCAALGCPVLTGETYCDAHRPAPWAGSTRRSRLPTGWPKLVAFILKRDGNRCYLCGSFAGRVDHIVAGDNHHPSNLAAICLACDKRKSSAEGGRASWRYRR